MNRRVVFVQLNLNPPGGGNAVAAWMLQALQQAGASVTLVSWELPDWSHINAFYGTSLKATQVERPPLLWRLIDRLAAWLPGKGRTVWQSHFLMGWLRGRCGGDELLVSACDEMNLGRPSIQYVHFPYRNFPGPRSAIRTLLLELGSRWSGWSPTENLSNLTLVNSAWTGEQFRQRFGAGHPSLLYPPVRRRQLPPWSQRARSFLCVGSIDPRKELEKVVSIVAGVRERGHPVALTLMGSGQVPAYVRRLRALQQRYSDWLTLLPDCGEVEFERQWSLHRYGLHGMTDEHFGISVAEMALAGVLPFVPDSGGQVEIVVDPDLRYRGRDHAVEQICRMLELDDSAQQRRVDGLQRSAQQYSREEFCSRFLQQVNGWCAGRGGTERTPD